MSDQHSSDSSRTDPTRALGVDPPPGAPYGPETAPVAPGATTWVTPPQDAPQDVPPPAPSGATARRRPAPAASRPRRSPGRGGRTPHRWSSACSACWCQGWSSPVRSTASGSTGACSGPAPSSASACWSWSWASSGWPAASAEHARTAAGRDATSPVVSRPVACRPRPGRAAAGTAQGRVRVQSGAPPMGTANARQPVSSA